MDYSMDDIMKQLCSCNKLDRDKAVVELEKVLTTDTRAEGMQCLEKYVLNVLSNSNSAWEGKHGCLLASKSLVPYLDIGDKHTTLFLNNLKCHSVNLLTDPDFRVRLTAGEVLGALCNKIGIEVYLEVKDVVLKLIRNNLEKVIEDQNWSAVIEHNETERLVEKIMSGPSYKRRSVADVSQALNETAGWKNLETSLKTLDFLIQGCGEDFSSFIDEELLVLLFKTLSHSNHCVRLTGFQLCASLFKISSNEEDFELQIFSRKAGNELCQHLANGLADNWSQVRLSASVATRCFLLSIPEQVRHVYFPMLLPRMCLNRYYVAEGVRIYSQETWRQVTGASGRELVIRFIGPTVEYYQQSTMSENHAVREAACSCISELASKMPTSSVATYVTVLLKSLIQCFQDNSWPVRDAACLACGNFIVSFPDECRPFLDIMYPMFFRNLAYPNASVRQGAATALANVVRAYGEPALLTIMAEVKKSIDAMDKQQSSPSRGNSSQSKRQRDFDLDSMCIKSTNLDNTELSSQPWHIADGCTYLVSELSNIKETHSHLIEVLPMFKEATKVKHYEHHAVLLESVCKQLPIIAKNLGKKAFSGIVEHFFDDLFYALGSENGLTSSSASQCLNHLATFLGQNILRAKVSNYNPRYVTALESVIFIAPF